MINSPSQSRSNQSAIHDQTNRRQGRRTPPSNDNATGSVTIPVVDVTLPYLPDAPRFAFPTPGAGLPPSFGSQGTNKRLPLGLGAATNGNNLFGLNFFDIGNDNLGTANNVGTGLQGIIAGNENTLAGNQVITPTSFGTNFGWMGNNNVSVGLPPPLLKPSGNNTVGSPFSYGNNTFIMGNNNDGTGNNTMLARATSVTTCTGSETTPTAQGTTPSPVSAASATTCRSSETTAAPPETTPTSARSALPTTSA
jgi:hypothetical protein